MEPRTDSQPNILSDLRNALIVDDTCPECLGELDTGYECIVCGHDAAEEMYKDEEDEEEKTR